MPKMFYSQSICSRMFASHRRAVQGKDKDSIYKQTQEDSCSQVKRVSDYLYLCGLYRRLRGLARGQRLEPAIRRAACPLVFIAGNVSASEYVMTLYVPEAHSIGDAVFHFMRGVQRECD